MVSIWLLTHRSHPQTLQSVMKIMNRFYEKEFTDVQVVYEEDTIMEMGIDGLQLYINGNKLVDVPKIVFVRIDSSFMDINYQVTLLKHLKLMGAEIVNDISCIENAINKVLQFQVLAKYGIPVPKTFTYSTKHLENVHHNTVKSSLSFPIIVKSVNGNCGNKVFMMHSPLSLKEMSGVLQHNVPYLFQEYIQESHGRDMRVIVIQGKPVFTMIRYSNSEFVQANLSQGGSGEVVTGKYPEAEELACKIADVLKMDIVGVDLLFCQDGSYVCCEVNNNPGFSKPIYKDYHIEKYIVDMLLEKLAKHI